MVRKALSDKRHFVYLNLHVSHKYSLCPLFFNEGIQKTRRKKIYPFEMVLYDFSHFLRVF